MKHNFIHTLVATSRPDAGVLLRHPELGDAPIAMPTGVGGFVSNFSVQMPQRKKQEACGRAPLNLVL